MAKVITLRLDTDSGTYLCDTYSNSSIQISKRIQSIDTLDSSQGVITKQQFRVPLIGQLADALGDLTELQIAPKVDIRKSIKGSILVNGYPRFNGSFQVIGIYKNEKNGLKEVELIFKGSETDLKSVLTDIKLSDLLVGELLDYNMAEIYEYITDTDNYITDNDYSWALIDYGQQFAQDGSGRYIYNPLNPLTQGDFKPQVFMRKIFNLLPIPITVDSTAIDLLNQVIPLHNNDRLIPQLDTSPLDYTGSLSTVVDIVFLGFVPSATAFVVYFQVAYNYNQIAFDTVNNKYDIGSTGLHTFNINFNFAVRATDPAFINLAISIVRTSDGQVLLGSSVGELVLLTTTYKSINIQKSFEFSVEKGDSLKLIYGIDFQPSPYVDPINIDFKILPGTKFEVTASPEIIATSKVDVPANCPDLTAWDCVRTIIAQCNGILESTDDGYNIKPWVKWVDEGTTFNIESKIDANKDINIEPTNVTGAKSILLSYKGDGDFLNKIYKDLFDKEYGNVYIEDTGTDFTKDEFKIDIPFAATPMTYVAGTSVIIPKFLSTDLKTVKAKPRLLYHSNFSPLTENRMGNSIPLRDAFSLTVYNTQIGFPFVGHWENINGGYNTNDYNFGTTLNFFASSGFPNNTLYNRFWKRYIEETYGQKARKIKLSLRITQNEFDALKMNEVVFYRGNNLRFLSINNFDIINEEFTECELVFRASIDNVDIAPYYPYDIENQIVKFKDSSTNDVVVFFDPSDLQESCEAYGYFYDSTLDLCVQRGNIIQI